MSDADPETETTLNQDWMERRRQDRRSSTRRRADRVHSMLAGNQRPGQDANDFHLLMPHRVQEILVVASAYDSFILEEDGRFTDRISDEYLELRLSSPPNIYRVSTGAEALQALQEHDFDLLLTTGHFADMPVLELAQQVVEHSRRIPVVYLAFDRREAAMMSMMGKDSPIDFVFQWSGDPRILLALVKTVEDRRNVQHDTQHGRVRVILVVEDSPTFYSSYLPILYTEIMKQTHRLMAERVNEVDRLARMRARPKVLLARSYEEATALYERYEEYLLGVVTDMRFPRAGQVDRRAGEDFIQHVKENRADTPILLQSAEPEHCLLCDKLGVSFAHKSSSDLLNLLRAFMARHFGFGSFVFRIPTGEEVGRAENLREMLDVLSTVTPLSIQYHAERNDFSNWFMARSEFGLAQELRPRTIVEFGSVEHARQYLFGLISDFLVEEQRGRITDFAPAGHHLSRDFTRIGVGSLGGKARGIAFLGSLLASTRLHDHFENLRIFVPRTTVICTGVFDEYVDKNDLRERAMSASCDEEVRELFLSHRLEPALVSDLADLLEVVRYPLAVRSSSLLEDSRFQPFAGVYNTYLIPNNASTGKERLEQLCSAIQLIYASTFMQAARGYMRTIGQRIEEEKMAIVIQRLVGTDYGRYFYPDFAGVAKSHNFYPMDRMKPDEGIATVALGLGRTVVEGRKAVHFSPAYPRVPLQMGTTSEVLSNSQRRFYALDLESSLDVGQGDEMSTLAELQLDAAEKHGALQLVGATYMPENDRIYDSVRENGEKLVNFAGVLKYDRFPLAPALRDVLEVTKAEVGTDIELEFAACRNGRKDDRPELAIVQLRPMVTRSLVGGADDLKAGESEHLFLAGKALGGGAIDKVTDVVYVHPDRYDRTRTVEVARAIGRINESLTRLSRATLFMAPGRWGSSDRFLGVPVGWQEISSAKILVELSVPGYSVDPSQGSHFFHNITSMRLGYFNVNLGASEDEVDLDWLERLPACHEDGAVRHVELPDVLVARIHSREGRGVVLRTPDFGDTKMFPSSSG